MLSQFRIITPPAASPVDLDLLAQHGRIDSDNDRELIALYRDAAVSIVEKFLGRALMPQTVQWTVSQMVRNSPWPFAYAPATLVPLAYEYALRMQGGAVVELPYSPVQSITSVAVGTWGGDDTVLVSGTDYTFDFATDPARLRLDSAWSWGTYNHLSVRYVAGYAAVADIPVPIINAIMMLALNLYENRGDDAGGGLSHAVKMLLHPYRLVTYAG